MEGEGPDNSDEVKESILAVEEAILGAGIPLHVREFPGGTRTSRDAAQAIGCEIGQIAKSIIFRCEKSGDAVLVIASGPNRVDTAKLERETGKGPLRMMAPGDVMSLTGFEVGGVPPVGHRTELTKLIDRDLLQHDVLWAAAGTPSSVLSIRPADLVRITSGRIADVKE
jgi:prolyl-tRNA editing enzyme YbaK/EbsC (Cys-tRNA(Pro) deacylase)